MKIKNAYRIITLENGLTLILYPIKEIQSIYIASAIKSGNYYAKDEKHIGIAHFLEHLAFSSTEKFKTNQEIFKRIYEIGGSSNAKTTLAGTLFWIKAPYINADKAVDLLYQVVFRSSFTKKDFEKEKSIIINEFNDNYTDPIWVFNQKIRQNRFKDIPQYQLPVTGDIKHILSIQDKDIILWKKRFLNPSNMVISVIGKFDEKKVTSKIKRTFGKERKGKKTVFPKYQEDRYSKFTVYVQKNESKQINFNINFPAFGWCEVERHHEIVLNILNNILGKGHLSRLWLALRETEGLTYDCGSYTSLFPYLGYLSIYGSTDINNLEKTFRKIKSVIEDIKENGVKKEEFSRIKKYLNLLLYMSFETPESISGYLIGELMDYGEIWSPEDYSKERSKVKMEEIKKMAQEIFKSEKMNVNFLGDISQEKANELAQILL